MSRMDNGSFYAGCATYNVDLLVALVGIRIGGALLLSSNESHLKYSL